MGKSTISMVIFNSYVKLPEGKSENVSKNGKKYRDFAIRIEGFSNRTCLGVPIGTSMGGNHHRMVIS